MQLTVDWKDIEEIVIFGFGRISQGNIDLFIDKLKVICIIDNNPKFCNETYRNIPIISFCQFLSNNKKRKIVVLSGKKVYTSISQDLIDAGMIENKDFCHMNVFFFDWFWNIKQKICVGRTIVSLTTYCTLNCKNCNMLTPYNNHKKSYDLCFLENDVDLLLKNVDFISNFVIVGGEALLYKELPEYIEYVGKNYVEKIGNIQIITNGTLIPDENLIDVIKKYNVEIRISDYTCAVDYKEKIELLQRLLTEKRIKHITFLQDEWLDFGFPEEKINMGNNKEELRSHMLACQPMCPMLYDGKIYYCTSAWAAEASGLFPSASDDLFDLRSIKNGEDRERLLSFYMGDMQKGYINFCKVCRGFDVKMQKVIPGALQY